MWIHGIGMFLSPRSRGFLSKEWCFQVAQMEKLGSQEVQNRWYCLVCEQRVMLCTRNTRCSNEACSDGNEVHDVGWSLSCTAVVFICIVAPFILQYIWISKCYLIIYYYQIFFSFYLLLLCLERIRNKLWTADATIIFIKNSPFWCFLWPSWLRLRVNTNIKQDTG